MNIRMMAVAAFAASCAFGGARIETPLGGDGWKLWLDKKAEYKSDQLHLNPADAAKIRANAGDWLTPVDVRARNPFRGPRPRRRGRTPGCRLRFPYPALSRAISSTRSPETAKARGRRATTRA